MHRYYRQQSRQRITGGRFDYFGVSSVKLAIVGDDDICRLKVSNGSRRQIVSTSAAKFCDLAVSGPGGLHPSFAEAVSTCYAIYGAWLSTSAEYNGNLVLFAVPTGTVINAALIALLAPTVGYDYWTLPIGMIVNDGVGDQYVFEQSGHFFKFHDGEYGEAALVTGTEAVGAALVDLSDLVPFEAVRFRLYVIANSTGAAAIDCNLFTNNGAVLLELYETPPIQNAAGYSQYHRALIDVDVINDTDDLLYYLWSGAVTGGLSLMVQGVYLYDSE